jgi:hypothetical protein
LGHCRIKLNDLINMRSNKLFFSSPTDNLDARQLERLVTAEGSLRLSSGSYKNARRLYDKKGGHGVSLSSRFTTSITHLDTALRALGYLLSDSEFARSPPLSDEFRKELLESVARIERRREMRFANMRRRGVDELSRRYTGSTDTVDVGEYL